MFVREAGPSDTDLPVVLLHGWTLNADLNFAGVYARLSAHHRLVAPDVLGHGRSARAEGDWKLRDASDGVIALLDHLRIDRAIIVGFSMGGVMSVDLAHRYPDRVAGIVVQSSAACYTTTLRNRMLWRAAAALWPVARRWPMTTLTARGYSDSLHRSESLRGRWDWAQDELKRMTLAEALTAADEVRRSDLRPTLGPLRCPAEYTVLTGDRLCQPPLQRHLAQLIGAVETDLHGDHDLPLVHPESYGEATVAAIRRVAARAPIAR